MMMTQAVRCLSLGQGAPPSNITTEALHPTARFYGLCLMPSLLSTWNPSLPPSHLNTFDGLN